MSLDQILNFIGITASVVAAFCSAAASRSAELLDALLKGEKN